MKLEDNGRRINDRQYLENALKPQRSFTSEAASRNQIRTLLGSFFRERDCVTLVRPAEDEATLKKLSQVPVSSLRPEFQRGLANLKDKVYAQTRAKSVNGRALSGAMLATLAKTYADALNAGGAISASRCVEDSCPSHDDVGGFFVDFEAIRTDLTEMLRAGRRNKAYLEHRSSRASPLIDRVAR